MRKAILPEKRLAITLRYLAKGDSYETLADAFGVGTSTVVEIIAGKFEL